MNAKTGDWKIYSKNFVEQSGSVAILATGRRDAHAPRGLTPQETLKSQRDLTLLARA
jgi:hypothetical protein